MKNIFKSLMLVAVAAMGIACQENLEENFAPINPNEVVMTISAELDESTRTYISDEVNGKIAWSEGDQLKVIENSALYRTTQAATIAADGKAKFSVSFPANTSASEFTYDAIFPASAVVEDDAEKVNVEKIKVIVKDQQKPTATSFDPQADVLVANQLVFDAQPTELNMQFKRLVAMGRIPFGSPTMSNQAVMPFTTLKLGPGDSARSHTADEYILLSEIAEAVGVYYNVLNNLEI
jgi:acetylornithine deacetylase/succinyl-diaminopimelate desuccinylase-like protein